MFIVVWFDGDHCWPYCEDANRPGSLCMSTCQDCDCWLSKAERVVNWLRDNQKSIGEWFKLERKRIQRQLEAVPQIGDLK